MKGQECFGLTIQVLLDVCSPYYYFYYPHKKGNLDANRCVKPHNKLAQEYNRQLKDQVFQLRRKFPLAKFTYVDVYTVKYKLISNAGNQGNVQVSKSIHHWLECNVFVKVLNCDPITVMFASQYLVLPIITLNCSWCGLNRVCVVVTKTSKTLFSQLVSQLLPFFLNLVFCYL